MPNSGKEVTKIQIAEKHTSKAKQALNSEASPNGRKLNIGHSKVRGDSGKNRIGSDKDARWWRSEEIHSGKGRTEASPGKRGRRLRAKEAGRMPRVIGA